MCSKNSNNLKFKLIPIKKIPPKKPAWNKGLTAKDHPRVLGGKDSYWYGKKLSKKHKKKMSESAKKPRRIRISIENLPKNQTGINHPFYGKHHTEETKEKLRLANIGKKHSKEIIEKRALSLRGKPRSKWVKKKISESHKGKRLSEKTKQKIREARKKQVFPKNKTQPELKISKIIDKYNLPIKYVGNGSYWIGKINPDFIAINGKLAIEVFGEYWHDPTLNSSVRFLGTEEGRRKYLKSFDWDLIVLWQSEIERGEQFILSKLDHPLLMKSRT